MSEPTTWTVAPYFLHALIFMIGAFKGITTVTGMDSSLPWYANANAWLPADAATTPRNFCFYNGYKMTMKSFW